MAKKNKQTPKAHSALPAKKQRPLLKTSIFLLLIATISAVSFWLYCIQMPGTSYTGEQEPTKTTQENATVKPTATTEPASDTQQKLEQTLQEELRSHVVHLATTIGERNLAHHDKLNAAADYLESELTKYGYQPTRQTFRCRQLDCHNIVAEIKGTTDPEKIIIIGAHYDSAQGTPGANDNGSGTSAMLTLARHFAKSKPTNTLRFVGFTNEEPPYFQNRGEMGSWVYAESCRQKNEDIQGVISLETMGYFSDEENSQNYPSPLDKLYPSTGNFIGFVSDLTSRQLQRRVIKVFRDNAKVPSEGASLPDVLPGIGWSDHWSFWQEGYPGIMVTDTAPFRYKHYHKPTDTPDKIEFARFAKVVEGLKFVVQDLAGIKE